MEEYKQERDLIVDEIGEFDENDFIKVLHSYAELKSLFEVL